jgi:2,3,4,5-tetrahydropyridine-2-carboxylate N-succinyltransferase
VLGFLLLLAILKIYINMREFAVENMRSLIEWAWENKEKAAYDTKVKHAVDEVVDGLDSGTLRICEKQNNEWTTYQWLKKAVLLYFRMHGNTLTSDGVFSYFDKVPVKTTDWNDLQFETVGARFVPGSVVRKGAFISRGVVLMPSFVNIGAFVDEGTMVDTWVTIGSCAQIGKNCHISGGVGIGGVLEPVQANPVIIEDNCFIGARSEIAEGVIVEEGAVISMGVFIGASTKIIDRESGEVYMGRVPAYSVVVPGSQPTKNGLNLSCAVIVKRVDEKTRSKTAINELLRD